MLAFGIELHSAGSRKLEGARMQVFGFPPGAFASAANHRSENFRRSFARGPQIASLCPRPFPAAINCARRGDRRCRLAWKRGQATRLGRHAPFRHGPSPMSAKGSQYHSRNAECSSDAPARNLISASEQWQPTRQGRRDPMAELRTSAALQQ